MTDRDESSKGFLERWSRKKIDAEGPPLIHTVRGVGYSLRLPKG